MTATKQKYREGQMVRLTGTVEPQDDGSNWPPHQQGTLMTDMGDGEWLVDVPGHGSPLVHEREFELGTV